MGCKTAVVVIGRNEGERLKICLLGVIAQTQKVVYVDSGSTDSSVIIAKSLGISILELDSRVPFSAGRARNEGFGEISVLWPDVKYVQFVDGDCELENGWLDVAENFLTENSGTVIVSGKVRERDPDKSIYNFLCEREWDTPSGYTNACGGIFMVKADAFKEIGGFNPRVIAGEEPELCYRIQQKGMAIYKLDKPMVLHDANITKFSQWWKRTMRSGFAYAQGFFLHVHDGKGYCLKESLRIWFWAFVLPLIFLLLALILSPFYLLLSAVYFFQIVRIAIKAYNNLNDWYLSLLVGIFNILGKWAQLIGQFKYLLDHLVKNRPIIIEYKHPSTF